MPAAKTRRLDSNVRAACPLAGLSVGRLGDSSTVRLDFAPEATPQQRIAAQAVVDAFDWSDAAQAAWEADQFPERKDLRAAAAGAIADNDAFLAIASPSNAQVLAQVRRLTQQNNRIIRRLSQID
jgi:hypothetical protein